MQQNEEQQRAWIANLSSSPQRARFARELSPPGWQEARYHAPFSI